MMHTVGQDTSTTSHFDCICAVRLEMFFFGLGSPYEQNDFEDGGGFLVAFSQLLLSVEQNSASYAGEKLVNPDMKSFS